MTTGPFLSPFVHCSDSGLVQDTCFIPSPNFDDRPDRLDVSVLVIHAISLPPDCYHNHYVEDLFTNCLDPEAHPYFQNIAGLALSAHFYIKRKGRLTQFVPTHHRAWHAGESMFRGRPRVNDFSIGIELEGSDHDEFESAQYLTLARLTRCLLSAYPKITLDNITGHNDIAPGRKTDPGPYFDWNRYRELIKPLD